MRKSVPCDTCQHKHNYGFRERGEKCNCAIDGSKTRSDLVQWLKYHGVGAALDDATATYDQIIGALRAGRKQLREALYFPQTVEPLQTCIANAHHAYIADSSEPWEYLDVGCGNMSLSRLVANVIGAFPQGVDLVDRRGARKNEGEVMLTFNGKDVPFPDGTFSVVTCLHVLHHAQEPEALLKSIWNVLSQGGLLIVREHDCRSWDDSYSIDFLHSALSEVFSDEVDVHEYRSRSGWRQACTRAGFDLLERDGLEPGGCYRSYVDVFRKPYSNSLVSL